MEGFKLQTLKFLKKKSAWLESLRSMIQITFVGSYSKSNYITTSFGSKDKKWLKFTYLVVKNEQVIMKAIQIKKKKLFKSLWLETSMKLQ